MAPVAPARVKLYPLKDPRMAYAPTMPVAGALPSQTTAVVSVLCPQRDHFVVSNAAGGGGGGGGAGATSTGLVDPDALAEPPFQLRIARPVLSRSTYTAQVIDQNGVVVLTVRALPHGRRAPAVYHIYDESTVGSTKGMPKRVPVFAVVDRAHLAGGGAVGGGGGPALVDAVVTKSDKPILSMRVDQPLSQDAAWTMHDAKSDRPAITMYDFVPDPSLPPTVNLKIEPPFCNQIALVLALWSISYDIYTKRLVARHRRR